ncbi:Cytochrome P450 4B1 [Bagarius yarrelli]|uniref:Cytochrome P450 4B1 n=1 Tax=Bagarius yarrelli TaxID=175774 RepID=A0A556TQB8_BAGYA|nr:Cytochrome P450 4B1 [Bagarius yarrelli]
MFKQDGKDLDKIPKWGEEYPFAFPLQFAPDIIFLFVHHPSYVKPILATTGEGLLVTDGQKWFRHRRLLTPGFHYDILKPYVNLMADSAKVMLDEEQQGLSDEAIRAEVDTFMFEGHDTTASGISWIFYSMACNPDHQKKCREEIQQVLMGKDTIEWEDLGKIPYTTMCIKESLRMYPPVPDIGRMLSKPITFSDGRTVPAVHLKTFSSLVDHNIVVLQFKQDGTDLDKIPKWGKQYPFAFPIQFSPDIIFLFVHHPTYVKPILAATGEGLLVTDGQKWFRHRRLLTPGFHYDILKPYVNLMADSAKVMLDKWEAYAKTGQTFELFQHVSLMTLDSIMKCAFSYQSNCQTESSNPYIKAVYELCYLVNLRFRVFPYHNELIFHMSPHGYRYKKACKIAHTHTEKVIKQRREILNEKKKNQEDTQEKRYLDFLDILLYARDEEQQGLSDEAIRAEVDTFMFEGHDTTASGISWIFYSMACNPDHQKKCREEIQQVLMGKDTMEWYSILDRELF